MQGHLSTTRGTSVDWLVLLLDETWILCLPWSPLVLSWIWSSLIISTSELVRSAPFRSWALRHVDYKVAPQSNTTQMFLSISFQDNVIHKVCILFSKLYIFLESPMSVYSMLFCNLPVVWHSHLTVSQRQWSSLLMPGCSSWLHSGKSVLNCCCQSSSRFKMEILLPIATLSSSLSPPSGPLMVHSENGVHGIGSIFNTADHLQGCQGV